MGPIVQKKVGSVGIPVGSTEKQKRYFSNLRSRARRWSIFDLFVYKYNGLEPADGDFYKLWQGRDGLATKIRKDLDMKPNSGYKLIPIFEQILECHRTESDFDPVLLEKRGGQRPHLISLDSPEAQIVADGIESGLSMKRTWNNVNLHRQEGNLEMLSESSVISAYRRLKPKISKIRKRKQGSNDPTSSWSRARLEWTTQLLVRFGELRLDELPRPLERRFDRDQIGHLDLHQVVWWDETHRKCLIGGLSASKDYHIEFPRDSSGKIDPKNGEYAGKKISRLNVKYEKECRMGLGCAIVQPVDTNGLDLPCEGRRCELFDYTSKTLISITDYKKMVASEIARVRKCPSTSKKWIEKRREDEKVYACEKVDRLKKCGNVTKKKLGTIGIVTVRDMQNVPNPEDIVLPQGLTRATFVAVWQKAKEAETEDAPSPLDHRKATNPYVSKYGEDWEKHIKKSPTLLNSVVITDYIHHMMDESARIMRGTKFSQSWMIYHDALSLMRAKETKKWMEEKGYLERWILPSKDLYNNLPALEKKFGQNPIGNSPDLMPWDAHLNSDVHASLDYHCLVSKQLKDDDPKIFDASTPKKMLRAYRRILDPTNKGVCPSSRRIIQDVRRIIIALETIRAADGCMVEDKKIRSGRRYVVSNEASNWGGKRVKKPSETYLPSVNDLHEDLLGVRQQQILSALEKFKPIDHRDLNDETRIPLNIAIDENNETTESEESSENILEKEI